MGLSLKFTLLLSSLLWVGAAQADALCTPGHPPYDDCCYETNPKLKQLCPSKQKQAAPAKAAKPRADKAPKAPAKPKETKPKAE